MRKDGEALITLAWIMFFVKIIIGILMIFFGFIEAKIITRDGQNYICVDDGIGVQIPIGHKSYKMVGEYSEGLCQVSALIMITMEKKLWSDQHKFGIIGSE